MRHIRALFLRLGGFFHKGSRERELAAELESHLQFHIADNLRSGMSPQEARRQALLKLGGLEQTKELYRERRSLPVLETLLQDIRFGARIIRKQPAVSVSAIFILALGIGFNSAVFSAVYAVLLKSLPFRDSGQLVSVMKSNPERGWVRNNISQAEFLAWRNGTHSFKDMAALAGTSCVLTGTSEPAEEPCEIAESNLFPLLGVAPIRGRTFTAEEDKLGSPKVAILSYGLWQRRFGGQDSAIGKPLTVNGADYTIAGVLPPSIGHLYASPYSKVPRLWLSGIALSPTSIWNDYYAVARLKPGATLQQAHSEMDLVSARIGQTFPDLKGWRADLIDFRELASADSRSALLLLLGGVTFVLLIACANVANLMLARGAARGSEFAVRRALGACKSRLIRQLLTESLLISLAGGFLGALLAAWVKKGLSTLAPAELLRTAPELASNTLDIRVLAFTFAVALATTLLFGLAPAIRGANRDVNDDLKDVSRGANQSVATRSFRSAPAITEVALSVVLLVGAGLMIRTISRLNSLNLGFNPQNLLTMSVPLAGERYKDAQAIAAFWTRVVISVQTLPGVESASVTRGLPIEGWAGQYFTAADAPPPLPGQTPDANYVVAGPAYFNTFHIPIRAGRTFTESDRTSTERIVIVNGHLAHRMWPGQDPLGKRIRMGSASSGAPWLAVVGVAGNVLSEGPDVGFQSELYVPYLQYPWLLAPKDLVVRTKPGIAPSRLTSVIQDAIHAVDPNQPVTNIRTMEEVAAEPMAQQRMVMALLGAFAALALILSAFGTYSVLAYFVAHRTREIGVRMALGASPTQVLRLVLQQSLLLVGVGLLLGLAGAASVANLLTSLLFGIKPSDPATYAVVVGLLLVVAFLATSIPARRAMRVDPMIALRYE